MYRFPWYLTLVSTNHASSNPGQIFSLCSRRLEVTRRKERTARERHAREEGPTSLACVSRAPRSFLRSPLPRACYAGYLMLLNDTTQPPKMVGKLIAKWGIS